MTWRPYIPQYLPISLKHRATNERRSELMARTTQETAHWFRPNTKLTLPCKHCLGFGCYTESKDGKRRKFDHLDFSSERGDRYEASCPVCRGGQRREVTLKEVRRVYRRIRKRVCEERGFEKESFDRMVKRQLGKDHSPTAWYEAAKRLAETLGIEV